MDTHLILYVDFLGVKDFVAVQEPFDEKNGLKLTSLIHLLHEIAELRGSFEVNEQPIESGRQFVVRPEISTFSDHIVIS